MKLGAMSSTPSSLKLHVQSSLQQNNTANPPTQHNNSPCTVFVTQPPLVLYFPYITRNGTLINTYSYRPYNYMCLATKCLAQRAI